MSGVQSAFAGGFRDAPRTSARVFRAAMSAMARPGRIETLGGAQPPKPLSAAAGALLLTLCDADTGLYLAGAYDSPDLRGWLTFHTGAPFVDAGQADFAVGTWADLMPLDRFAIGTAEYPDRSATLIVERDQLAPEGAVLTGPGIRGQAALSVPDVTAMQANAALYPLGLDFFFTCGGRVAAVPRSTKVMAVPRSTQITEG